MKLHALCGLPRSGSTLLGNLLAQHPDVHVTGTSVLSACVGAVSNVLSNSPEVQSDLANVPGAYDRYVRSLHGFIDGWYADVNETVVIDKGRGWITQPFLLNQIHSGARLIVTVRDPRDVIASIERKHRDTGVFNSPVAPMLRDAASTLLAPEGIVGGPMRFVEDLLHRRLGPPDVNFVRYETLTIATEAVLSRLHEVLDLPSFTHDYDDVKNVATDLDALHRGKYPHDASGTVKSNESSWRDVIDESLGQEIASVCPLFMQTFEYVA